MTDIYLKYGNCYLIKIRKEKTKFIDVFDICSKCKYETRISQSKDNIYVIILNTFNRPAHELKYDLMGDHIYKLDGFTAGILLEMLEECKAL